jgi:hypothetical protein
MQLINIIKELQRRSRYTSIIDGLYESQKKIYNFLYNENKFICVSSPRRAGKSYTCLCLAVWKAGVTAYPGARMLFLGINRQSAIRTAYDLVVKICNKYSIQYEYNRASAIFTFTDTGSTLELGGWESVDQSTYLGAQFDLVFIDECSNCPGIFLASLINETIRPTLLDRHGKCIMVSSPKLGTDGPWYESCTIGKVGYDVVKLHTLDNLSLKHIYEAELDQLKTEHKGIDIFQIPWVRREYLGEFAIDESSKVYQLLDSSLIDMFEAATPRYVLAIDLGWSDACGFLIAATNKHERNFYVCESYKRSKMPLEDIIAKIEFYRNKYENLYMVIDCAGGGSMTLANEIATRFNLDLDALHADKTSKQHWIEIVNTTMRLGNLLIIRDTNQMLVDEIQKLPWKINKDNTREEDGKFENHLTDCLLYAFKNCYPHLNRPLRQISVEEEIRQSEEKRYKHQKRIYRSY